jgi:hypothetical protein
MRAALAFALLGLSMAAAQTRWQPLLADRYQYQLGELFVVPDHLIPGVKVCGTSCAVDQWQHCRSSHPSGSSLQQAFALAV